MFIVSIVTISTRSDHIIWTAPLPVSSVKFLCPNHEENNAPLGDVMDAAGAAHGRSSAVFGRVFRPASVPACVGVSPRESGAGTGGVATENAHGVRLPSGARIGAGDTAAALGPVRRAGRRFRRGRDAAGGERNGRCAGSCAGPG